MADQDDVRSRMILKDIYARHGIDEDALPGEAALAIAGKAPDQSGWANPEERAKAREAYARRGKTDREVETRWGESAYLLDPDTYQYQQGDGRDIDFLIGMHEASIAPPDTNAPSGGGAAMPSVEDRRESGVRNALSYWDSSNFQPVSNKSFIRPQYASQADLLRGLRNITENPDIPFANAMSAGEVIPDRIRMGGSAEADTGEEAWEGAQAKRLATNRYRLGSMSPILDLPDNATHEDRINRIKELQALTQQAAVPNASQRWARSTAKAFGENNAFVPPGFVTDTLDVALSSLDPTILLPVGGAAGAAGKIAGKAAMVAGKGWVKPLLSSLAKNTGFGLLGDQGTEQAVGHGISGALGGDPNRTTKQFLVGQWGSPQQKSEEDVLDSRDARMKLHDSLKDDDGVSRADSEAYNRLNLRVHVPYPYR